ncbi:MAG TPA: GNAT family N-acetyltransferase [Solirubrobacteraceae bacterium]
MSVAPMTAEDWPAVARIYRAGIEAGNATFESVVPDWESWRAARLAEPCLVARQVPDNPSMPGSTDDPQGVHGWAALTAASSRPVYRGVAEISIYVDPSHARRGVGRTLLLALIQASERSGLWLLRAGIFPENEASIALHESCGFRLVGTHERIGQMPDGRWRDVVLYERRSEVVGTGS